MYLQVKSFFCVSGLVLLVVVVSSVASQFDVVAKRKLFIDRSLLVEHLFCKLRHMPPLIADHHFIIGARKSGKSTNLSMMKQFFEIGVDESGRVLAPNTTKHYALFKSLKIGQRPFFEQYFARIPVIHLNLAKFVVNGSEEDFKKSFCKVIRDLMVEHKYLLQSKFVNNTNKESLKTFSDTAGCNKQDILSLTDFGHVLARQMQQHFRSQVLVLIDEIDAPAMSILDSTVTYVDKGYFIRDVFRFVRETLRNGMGNIMGSFLTGATRQGVLLDDDDMNTFDHYAFEEELKNFYGVTEDEVRRLLSISGVKLTEGFMQGLREMYGGYGDADEKSKENVYNTRSIIKFCEEKVIKPYWDVASGIAPFKKLLSPEHEGPSVEKAMYNELIIERVPRSSEKYFFDVKDFLTGKRENPPHPTFSWSMKGYLWESGFFKTSSQNNSDSLSSWWSAEVVNNENRLILLDLVLNKDYYMAKHGVNVKLVRSFVVSVAEMDTSETLCDRLADIASHLFVKGAKDLDNEAVFRYSLYNYLRQAKEGLFSKVIAELGQKRQRKSDIIVTLKDGSKVFIGLTLDEESGQDALRQALEDKQLQEFSNTKSIKFICLGINLLRLNSRCDVSYLDSSTNFQDARNVTRLYQSTWAKISNRAKSWFRRATIKP